MNLYESWGRYPALKSKEVIRINWLNEIPDLNAIDTDLLAYAYGKSYGDSCLNHNGVLLDTKQLNHLISFDKNSGLIRCEAGFTLEQVLEIAVPNGWFPSSTPGTKFISIGGAIANDVHGKNHHKGGTFGCHLTQFELLRSDGSKLICSNEQNSDLFSATIGGMGLTGLITWAEFKLKPCLNPYIYMETIKFDSIDEFFEINNDSNERFEYTVSWVDCTTNGASLGRGIYSRGKHYDVSNIRKTEQKSKKQITFPFEANFINSYTVKFFNSLYFNKQIDKVQSKIIHYDPFFYPLDAVQNWNKAYGKNGFLQYQFVVPEDNGKEAVKEILRIISRSGKSSFMTVLKTFGDIRSPGMMSFPRKGITMAIDFRMDGKKTLELLNLLDRIVRDVGGGLYPAKDARMSSEDFKRFYSNWKQFSECIDPKFSSSFWRRVTQ